MSAPEPDQARDWVNRELARPEYHDESFLQRLIGWARDRLEQVINTTAASSPLATLATIVALFALVVAVAWLLSRVRSRGARPTPLEQALPEERISATEHRLRAEAALAGGDTVTACLEAFRAQAMRLVESGQVPDRPGATAAELAVEMSAVRPDLARSVHQAAVLFDAARYGDLVPQPSEVQDLLATDRALSGVVR